MEFLSGILAQLGDSFAVKYLLSPLYIGSTLAIVYAVWLLRGRPGKFFRFAVPRGLYNHPSTLVDIKIGLFNTLFLATGAISALLFTPIITIQILQFLGGPVDAETGWMRGLLAAVLLFLAQDLGRYCNHYLHHESRCLWPFHAVHHSAEVMTPITFMRAHPFYYAVQAVIISVLVGLVSALVLWGLIGRIENWIIYAGALAFNAYVFFGANIRHSHIWLSYGRVMEHVLISPAQHQIHHSSDPKHHDKNYGEVFAIWDWIFGTLYVPDGYEELEFGLADRDGNKIPQKHPTLYDALVGPFIEVWEDLTRGTSRDPSRDKKS